MILICYDISNDKKRRQFNKYIKQYGNMLQFSVYEITNSKRILSLIVNEIEHVFSKTFDDTDSIIIIETTESTKITKYGYPKHDEEDVIVLI